MNLPVQQLTPDSSPEEVQVAVMQTIQALVSQGMSEEEATQQAYLLAKQAMSKRSPQPSGIRPGGMSTSMRNSSPPGVLPSGGSRIA
jgi:uncharacterized protein YoaH (UPF0181 family)